MQMTKSAFLILDIQNDICHKDGIFNKNGLNSDPSKKIIPNIVEMMYFCKKHDITTIAIQHTILEDSQKKAIGLGIYEKMLPFTQNYGLRQNTWGHDLLDEIKEVNYQIKRWKMSPFHETELSGYLSALGVNTLILSGFTTNGIVETTAREAVGRNYKIITLSDCTAGYSESLHLASLTNLNTFGSVLSYKDWQKLYFQE